MHFKRVFTVEGKHPFDSINWIKTSSVIRDLEGKIIFSQQDVEFPDFWGQGDIDIFVEKYFAGAPGSKGRENSLKQSINRVVKWYKENGIKDKYFENEKEAQAFADELTFLLVNQYGSFNSPVWFNVGTNPSPQVSACFILSAEDTMKSIKDNAGIEMSVFEKGSGAGSNRSDLRSSVEKLSNGGIAMGPLAAERIYDAIAGAVKSGGKLRRAAKMSILDIDHGDVEMFIKQKAIVEKMAHALGKAGWNTDFNHPDSVYKFLPLQNFNESASVFNSFMECVVDNSIWALRERKATAVTSIDLDSSIDITHQGNFIQIGGVEYLLNKNDHTQAYKVIKKVKARDLFKEICESAWVCGDPGLQFTDTINKWHTCKGDARIRSSNPCSEFFFIDDNSCNLASLNLVKFDENDIFNVTKYEKAVEIFITAQDISVSNSSYPTKEIAAMTKQYRTLGLGYSNLGAFLLRRGLPYDSVEARYLTGAVTSLLTSTAYKQSAKIAKVLGAFDRYEANKVSVSEVLQMHIDSAVNLRYKTSVELESLPLLKSTILNILDASLKGAIVDEAVRNAQVTVIAPAGTISFIMGAETTGCEPMLGLITYKKLVGGGYMELTTPSVDFALQKLGYNPTDISAIIDYIKREGHVAGSVLQKKHWSVFATSFGKVNTIQPLAHISMLAEIQPFVSGGISKTVNLPNSATVEEISDIYMAAWKAGLKSVALYRDGSKASQPLSTTKEDQTKVASGRPKPVRKRLPKDRLGRIHEFSVGGQKGYLTLGFYPDTNQLGEVFIDVSKAGSTINGLIGHIGVLTSMLLQYGISPEEVSHKFKDTKFEPSGMTSNPEIKFASSIPDYIGKFLETLNSTKESSAKEIVVEKESSIELDGPPCLKCGHLTRKSGTCYACRNCGETTSCS